jgi:transcriptional antiterminator RfaH
MDLLHDENSSNGHNELKHDQQSEGKSLAAGCQLPAASSQRNGALRWYVVQSKPREEERALHYLQEKGFQTYLPRMEVVKVRKFKNVKSKQPLFRGYLFCRFKKEDEILAHVRWTKGVKKLLPESVSPMFVDDEIVQAIHSLEQEDGVIRKQPLQKNDQVRIARGPMKDVLGVFDHWSSDSGRVKVLLNFINYQAAVELHHSLVEKVA